MVLLNITDEEAENLKDLKEDFHSYKQIYDASKSNYQSLYRKNITDYFQTKTIKDFKNMKDYWNFNAAHVPHKSDKTDSNLPQALLIDGFEINDQHQMANEFNSFFTNLASTSNSTQLSCLGFIDKTFDQLDKDSSKYLFNNFKQMKTVNKLNITTFSFTCVDMKQLKSALNE